MKNRGIRIGIVGTGFVSAHFAQTVAWHAEYRVTRVLTRRPVEAVPYPLANVITDSIECLLESSDIVLECSGDPVYATDVIAAALRVGLPVVTLNAEFHVTAGSHFVGKGLVTEAEGDQPGSLAALNEEAISMGFKPLVYGNMKGFLNLAPSVEEMQYWAQRQGLSVEMTTAFTDGTKVQIEQALVANGLGAVIVRDGMVGPVAHTLAEAAELLGAEADAIGRPISDYALSSALSHGVFIVADHHPEHRAALAYFKLGDGPRYVLAKPNIMVHLEVMKTLERVRRTSRPLLNNSARPSVGVAAVAKRALEPGTLIERGIGSFDTRGIAVKLADHVGHVPIGLLSQARVIRPVRKDEILSMADVELPDSLALAAWCEIERSVRPS